MVLWLSVVVVVLFVVVAGLSVVVGVVAHSAAGCVESDSGCEPVRSSVPDREAGIWLRPVPAVPGYSASDMDREIAVGGNPACAQCGRDTDLCRAWSRGVAARTLTCFLQGDVEKQAAVPLLRERRVWRKVGEATLSRDLVRDLVARWADSGKALEARIRAPDGVEYSYCVVCGWIRSQEDDGQVTS